VLLLLLLLLHQLTLRTFSSTHSHELHSTFSGLACCSTSSGAAAAAAAEAVAGHIHAVNFQQLRTIT
jgi:hypothetical protein